MTVQDIGLGGQASEFLGCYVTQANTGLGLAQSPSTCTVTLVEDAYSTPPRVFSAPTLGKYYKFKWGSLRFEGVITSYNFDVANIGGRAITINMSDPREIMKSVPVILGPGYRSVVAGLEDTGCSIIDAYGAYDDFDNTGVNLSEWNQAGMTYRDVSRALKGGTVIKYDVSFNIAPQVPSVFGVQYYFDISEIDSKVDPAYRINNNLISVADLIQELASRHSFDWFVDSTWNAEKHRVDVTIRIIDRSVDNVDLDIDDFLALHSGIVVSASRGFELRNELSCGVLMGAYVEALQGRTITGMANNPIDLSSEGGSDKYYMTEEEMRYVLVDKGWWQLWAEMNGGIIRYSVGGAATLAPLWDPADATDIGNQIGINPNRASIETADEEVLGRIYEKLSSHAKATYGKRFTFSQILDSDYIDAAWTADVISGNNDPNEYFRNSSGKTRCYVEFAPSNQLTPNSSLGPNFTFGLGANAPQPLPLELRNNFDISRAITHMDKADWIIFNGSLYVAATIEEGNVVKLDSPVLFGETDPDEGTVTVADYGPGGSRKSATGTSTTADRNEIKRSYAKGETGGTLHQYAYQPIRVFVPTKSKYNRYGPVFASHIDEEAQGKVEIEVDDGFSPWEFGGISFMLTAMQFKIDNSSSSVREVETATITLAGYPILNIGESIGRNSNVNNISVSVGGNGVQTTYELRSFLRQFGELSKEELAALSLFARRGGARVFPQDSVSFINKYRPIISKQFAGLGSSPPSATTGGAGSFE